MSLRIIFFIVDLQKVKVIFMFEVRHIHLYLAS